MPAKKRIPREKILSAAMDILRLEGIQAVNVKALARSLDCSTQPIYLSFESMDGLREQLNSEAVRFFLDEIGYGDGKDVNLYGMPYIRFAQKEKSFFSFCL